MKAEVPTPVSSVKWTWVVHGGSHKVPRDNQDQCKHGLETYQKFKFWSPSLSLGFRFIAFRSVEDGSSKRRWHQRILVREDGDAYAQGLLIGTLGFRGWRKRWKCLSKGQVGVGAEPKRGIPTCGMLSHRKINALRLWGRRKPGLVVGVSVSEVSLSF